MHAHSPASIRLMMALTPKRLFLFLSLCISISLLRLWTFFSRSHLVNIFSLKMRVSSKELFSSLKKFLAFPLPSHTRIETAKKPVAFLQSAGCKNDWVIFFLWIHCDNPYPLRGRSLHRLAAYSIHQCNQITLLDGFETNVHALELTVFHQPSSWINGRKQNPCSKKLIFCHVLARLKAHRWNCQWWAHAPAKWHGWTRASAGQACKSWLSRNKKKRKENCAKLTKSQPWSFRFALFK